MDKNGKQQTVTWHVNNLKSSHVDAAVNNEFHSWLEKTYRDTKIGVVKLKRSKVHDYLGMVLDYSHQGTVCVDMRNYVNKMIMDFPEELDHEDVVNLAIQSYFC